MEGQGSPPNKRAKISLAAVPGAAATVPGGSRDRLSGLPDDLLVCILLKLGTKEAAKTTALSRRWRDVWARLNVLNFDGSVPDAALAAYKAHGEDPIQSFTVCSNQMDAQHTAAWLSLSEPLLSGRLHFNNSHAVSEDTLLQLFDDQEKAVRGDAFELPCFKKATEIVMDLGYLGLALPPAGVFDALRVMRLEHFWLPDQLSISDTMFPALEELTIRRARGLIELTLDSKSLLYVHLFGLPESQRLHISAPGLNILEVTLCLYNVSEPVATIAAERLEVLRWEAPCVPEFRKLPHLRVLRVPAICADWSKHICAKFRKFFRAVHDLELHIGLDENGSLFLMKDIAIPYVKTLWLYMETNGHVFNPRLLKLLSDCYGIRKLDLSFQVQDEVLGFCLPSCNCLDEFGVRGAEVVPISTLEEVNVVVLSRSLREVNFVEQLVLKAPMLKLLRITSDDVEDLSWDDIKAICPAGCRFELLVVGG